MIGIVFGTLCLLALVRVATWGRHSHHSGHHWGHRWGRGGCHGGGAGRRGFGPMGSEGFTRAAGEVFKRRLDVDEEQEGIVDHALGDLRVALEELSAELRGTRAGLGEAFKGDVVDEAAIAGAFARHDDALGRARRQVVSALKQIHAVLRPEQRARAAEWLASASPRWSR